MFNGGSNMSATNYVDGRAGRDAHLFDEFKSKEIVAIGWNETGDLSKLSTPGEIKQMVKKKYPDYKLGKLNISASQIAGLDLILKRRQSYNI